MDTEHEVPNNLALRTDLVSEDKFNVSPQIRRIAINIITRREVLLMMNAANDES